MAMLAVLDVDDLATPKIQRVKNALDDLTAQTAQTAKATASASKGFIDPNAIEDQLKNLTALNREMAQLRTQSGAWSILGKQMQEGTKVTKTQAAALMDLSGALLMSDNASHKLQYGSMVLAGGLKEGAVVTGELREKLLAMGQEFDKANGFISKTAPEAKKADDALAGMAKTAGTLMGALAALGASYKLKGLLEESFNLAARNQVLSTTIQVVSKNAHIASNEMELQAQKVKALGITTREAREAVISFAQAQLNIADTAKIARVAQDLAVVAGVNSSQAFDRLTRAIQSQQAEILRSFGIVKNTNLIYSEYAATLGKGVKQLTDLEKKQAFVNLIIKEGEKVAGAYTNAMNDVGKAMTSMSRYTEEAKAKLGEALLPIMLKIVLAATEVLKWFGNLSPETYKWAAAIGAAVVVMTSFLGIVMAVSAALPLLAAAWAALLGPIGLVALAIGAVTAAIVLFTATSTPQVEKANERALAYKAEAETLEGLKKKLGEQKEAYEKANAASADTMDRTGKIDKAARDYQVTLAKISETYPGVIRGEQAVGEQYEANVKRIDDQILKLKEQQIIQQQVAISEGKRAKEELDKATDNANRLRELYARVQSGGEGEVRKVWAELAATVGAVSPAILNVMQMMDAFGMTTQQKALLLKVLGKALGDAEEDLKSLTAQFEKFKAILDQIDPSRAAARVTAEVERISSAAGGMEKFAARAKQLGVDVTPVVSFDRNKFEKDVKAKIDEANTIYGKAMAATGERRTALMRDYVRVFGEMEALSKETTDKILAAENNFTTKDAEDKKKRQENLQKWQAAYKQTYESITETNATAGANFAGAAAALNKAGLSTEEYASRLLRAKSIVEAFNKASPEMRAKFKELAVAADELARIKLHDTLDKWEKKFTEVSTNVKESVNDMMEAFERGSAERIEAAGRKQVEEERKLARTVEQLQTELYERTVVAKMKEVDQKIYANNKYFENYRRGIEDQIRALRLAQEEEARAILKRQEAAERQLDDTIHKAKMRFKIEVETETEIEKAKKAIQEGGSKEEIERKIAAIKQRFDNEMNLLRDQGMRRIAEATAREQEELRIRKEGQDKQIAIMEETAERSKDVQARTNQEIRNDYDKLQQYAKMAFGGIVEGITSNFEKVLTGQASFKDALIGIWQSIKSTISGIIDSIVKSWIQGAMRMATANGGFSPGTFLSGLLGKGGPMGGQGAGADFVGPPAPGGGGLFGGHMWGKGLTTGGKVMGGLGGGAIGGMVGFSVGQSTGSKTWGAASGAATGAATGAMFGGPIGAGIGAGIGALAGLIGGWLGGKKQAEEAKKMREELIQQAGGLEQLKKKAEEAGFSMDKLMSTKKPKDLQKEIEKLNKALEAQAKIEALKKAKEGLDDTYTKMITLQKQAQLVGFDMKKLYDAKTIEEFNAEQEKLNKLLEDQAKRMAGLNMAATGLASRVKGLTGFLERSVEDWFKQFSDENRERFEEDFKKAGEAGFKGSEFEFARANAEKYGLSLDRLNERQARVQESINRIGQYATATFGGILRETGDITQAFAAVAGPLDELAAIMEQTGTKAEGALGYLMEFRNTIRNNEDVAASLSGINQMLMGLADAGRLTAEMFNTFGADASEQWRIMEERGVAADQALLLMQPTLQALYEAQKNYGFATDEATQKLIDMGVANGVVGDQFQDVNSKMLDMLTIIAEALGATIPDAYKRQSQAAAEAGQAGTQAAQDTAAGLEEQARQSEEAYKRWQQLEREMSRVDTSGVDGLADAVGGLPDKFGDAAAAAWDASQEIQDAMAAAQPDVDAISLGHSPGGLKEIRIKLREAIDSLREFRAAGRENLRGVEDSVNAVVDRMGEVKPATDDVFKGDRKDSTDPFADETAPRPVVAAPPTGEQPAEGEKKPEQPAVQVVLSPEFKIDTIDAAGMEAAVREKIGPQMIAQMRNNTDQLTVEIGRALDRYFGGRKSA
jgi:hypothetical protein